MDLTVVLVGPGRVRGQPRDGRVDLAPRVGGGAAGHGVDPGRELVGTGGEILGDVVENLPTEVAARPRPAGSGVRGLDGVADVLAVAFADFADEAAVGSDNATRVPLVGADLLAADEQFGRPVDGGNGDWGMGSGLLCRLHRHRDAAGVPFPSPHSSFPVRFEVLPHPLPAALAAEPGFAVAAEAGGRIEQVGAVDPHHARLDLGRDVEREVDVLGPDARRQAVGGVVGQLHSLRGSAERHRDENRPEDLHLRDGGRRGHVGEQRGRVEIALRRTRPGGLPHLGPLLHALVHEAADALELYRSDDGAHVDGLIQRRPDPELLHSRAQLGDQPLRHALLHQQARARAAHLPLVEPDRIHHALDHAVQIGVLKDEEWALAAQLE